jgi:N-acetylmuramoyl-L-alanine amidase
MIMKKVFNYSPNFNRNKRNSKQIKFLIFHYTGMRKEIDAINKVNQYTI